MTLIYARKKNKIKFVGAGMAPATAGAIENNLSIQDSDGVTKRKSENKSTMKVNKKRVFNRNAEKRKVELLLERAYDALLVRKISSRNPISLVSKLTIDLDREQKKLSKKLEDCQKKKGQRRYQHYLELIRACLGSVREYKNTLENEKRKYHAAMVNGSTNREMTAKAVKMNPRGNIIGKTNVVEYKAPGSTSWATPRKSRK